MGSRLIPLPHQPATWGAAVVMPAAPRILFFRESVQCGATPARYGKTELTVHGLRPTAVKRSASTPRSSCFIKHAPPTQLAGNDIADALASRGDKTPASRTTAAADPDMARARQLGRVRIDQHRHRHHVVERANYGFVYAFVQASEEFRRSTAPAERSKSGFVTHWYQFCICDIVSMLRMPMHGMRMYTEPVFL
jgi:hypothetical protein